MRSRVVFIGAVNEGERPTGGEEVKNQILVEQMRSELDSLLVIIDTYHWKYSPLIWFKLLFALFLLPKNKIIVSASTTSSYRLFKLMYFLRRSDLNKIIYLVIGGAMADRVFRGELDQRFYRYLGMIVVEGRGMLEQLNKVNLTENVKVLANFKKWPKGLKFKSEFNLEGPLRLVYLGRLCREKGVDMLIECIQSLNVDREQRIVLLDLYGPKDKKENYQSLPNDVSYKGFLNFDNFEAYNVLSDYDLMVFPTFWEGEGFPGVLIDAMISSLPVLASDWNMNREIITHGKNGFLFESKSKSALESSLLAIIENRECLFQMRKSVGLSAEEYHIEYAWSQLKQLIVK